MFYNEEQDQPEEYDDLATAINRAIDRCIEEDVLADFLRENRSEVVKVTQLDYTFDKQIELERIDARREGREEGREEGEWIKLFKLICKKKKKGLSVKETAELLEEEEEVVAKIYQLADECVPNCGEDVIYQKYRRI